MYRLSYIILILILFVTIGKAQLIDPHKNIFSEEPFFNEQFVASNNIKSLRGEIFYKRDGEKMHNKGVIIFYEFDERGKLTKQYSTFKKYGGEVDTTFIYYEYEENGRLSIKRTTDNFGFFSLRFKYDSTGNVIEEIYNRELNSNNHKGDFKLSKQYAMGVEKYEIVYFSPEFYKKIFLNNIGTPFKEVSFKLNENGKIEEETGTYITTRMLERKTFTYDKENRISKKTEYSDVNRDLLIKHIFTYDNKGNLSEIKKHHNEEIVQLSEFMFDENNLITNKLSRDHRSKMIEVVKFRYEFFPAVTCPDEFFPSENLPAD